MTEKEKKLAALMSRKRSIAQKKAKAKVPVPPLTAKALRINAKIRETGELPKPRVEVQPIGGNFHYRLIDNYGRKGDFGDKFTQRTNCRRAARKAHPGVPVISQDKALPTAKAKVRTARPARAEAAAESASA